ncbi:MAG: flippase-like domain-containing protein [Ilumatobacter sp.]|nr:flippase-like domain-containing protein [Ilumatobacter sp.]
MRRLIDEPRVRQGAVLLVALVLVAAVILQRQTIVGAIGEIGKLSAATVVVLALLGVLDRVSRAEVIRSLLPELTLTRSEMISDVGAAASKGIPAGGPIATVLRWQLARERWVTGTRFIVMLVASGVATAFVSWGYPLVATVVGMAGRDADLADVVIVAVCAAVLGGAALFWLLMLRSERAHRFITARSEWVVARWPTVLGDVDPAASDRDLAVRIVDEIRDGLRLVARRPAGLLLRTLVAQGTGAVILWVALRGLGVGDELELSEYARVYFVAHILGSLAPTPGGVGVIEAGVTGALVAAGVDTEVALAGVLVYRFITYVMPIILGTAWYVWWRFQRSAGAARDAARGAGRVDRSVRSGSDAVH